MEQLDEYQTPFLIRRMTDRFLLPSRDGSRDPHPLLALLPYIFYIFRLSSFHPRGRGEASIGSEARGAVAQDRAWTSLR